MLELPTEQLIGFRKGNLSLSMSSAACFSAARRRALLPYLEDVTQTHFAHSIRKGGDMRSTHFTASILAILATACGGEAQADPLAEDDFPLAGADTKLSLDANQRRMSSGELQGRWRSVFSPPPLLC